MLETSLSKAVAHTALKWISCENLRSNELGVEEEFSCLYPSDVLVVKTFLRQHCVQTYIPNSSSSADTDAGSINPSVLL